jgi:Tol biopolymer transport system component/tRNA A-37 threonylcarbamoyl transferase component Bud32
MSELIERLQTTLGSGYRITSELGGGGMSRVFVAEETELGRNVVVKVLPPDLAAGLNVDRFRREIQMAARLQHPHIVPLLSAGAKDGLLYYTMPFIQGETLRARLSRSGELPVADALRILREVADALEFAHANGIVHRDIKPENVLLSGHHALVTDFGVSKALSAATGEVNLTSVGVALGTPAYMSPEQATADPMADHRSDIYSLGVMGYELLAGTPPFPGKNPQQVLAAHVTEIPEPITKHRANLPPALANVIMRCLEKKPADRFQNAEEVRQQLEIVSTPVSGTIPARAISRGTDAVAPARVRRGLVIGGIAATVLLVSLIASKYIGGGSGAAYEVGAAQQITNDNGIEITPALSPDGKLLAYSAGSPFLTEIFVRQLSGGQPVRIGRGRGPYWSSDGSRLAFSDFLGAADAPALGGTVRRLRAATPEEWFGGPAYSHDGKRLAYSGSTGKIYVAAPDASNPRTLFRAYDPHSISWSPDDSRLVFVEGNAGFTYSTDQFANMSPSTIRIIGADGKEGGRIGDRTHLNISPVWSLDGEGLFFVSSTGGGRDIYYQRINGMNPVGAPQRLTTGLNVHSISVGGDGTLAYSVVSTSVGIWTVPVPASGSVSVNDARQITSAGERIEVASISADGQWLAFDSDRAGNADIYKMKTDGSGLEQLTHDAADDFRPSWSPDGRQILFHSWRGGTRDVFAMASDGSAQKVVAGGPAHEFADNWSPDGKLISYFSDSGEGFQTVFIAPAGGGSARQLTKGQGYSTFFSPDGKTVAYVAGDGLRIVPVEGGDSRLLVKNDSTEFVSTSGGWSADGKTIYYRAYTSAGTNRIARVSLDGSQRPTLVRFDNPERPAYRPEFSTDGKNFYFTIGKHQADIWLMHLTKK